MDPIEKKLAAAIGVDAGEIHATFAPLLSSLALPFFPGARESLVVAEAKTIADRLHRYTKTGTASSNNRDVHPPATNPRFSLNLQATLRSPRSPRASPQCESPQRRSSEDSTESI